MVIDLKQVNILPWINEKFMRLLNMKLLLSVSRLICNCVNIVYLYFHERNRVLIHEEIIPQFRRKLTSFLRPATPESHPTFIERPEFHHPSKGYLHIHHPSKGCLLHSVTASLI